LLLELNLKAVISGMRRHLHDEADD
jgi:hypothetical protein